MKLKGLTEVLGKLDELDDLLNGNIDNIEWDGMNDTRDQQKDEMLCAALDCVLAAREPLEEIKGLQLSDF